MAYTDIIQQFKLALYGDNPVTLGNLLTKIVDAGIDKIVREGSTVFKRMKKGPPLRSLVKQWMEQWEYDYELTGQLTTSTITFSGYLMNQAMSADLLRVHLRPGMILERASDGLQVKVTSIDAPNLQANVAAHGNTGSLSDDTTPTTWEILSAVHSDYDNHWAPMAIAPKFRYCGFQVFKADFEVPWLVKRMSWEQAWNRVTTQIAAISRYLENGRARSLLRMEPVYSGGQYIFGDKTTEPAIMGLLTWVKQIQAERANPDTYVNAAGVPIHPKLINDVLHAMKSKEHADFTRGDWQLAMHSTQFRYMAEMFPAEVRDIQMSEKGVGVTVRTFQSTVRDKPFPMLIDDHLRPSELVPVDCSDLRWGYVEGEQLRTIPIYQGDNSRVDKMFLTMVPWGVQMRRPRQSIGMIYGLPSTFA